mgnify:CR=1 FL=1
MIYIFNTELKDSKPLAEAMCSIYGIGPGSSQTITSLLGIGNKVLVKDLSKRQITLLTKYIQKNFLIQFNLKKVQKENIKRLVAIQAYKGSRHKNNLPVRGQRTITNAKTRKNH